MRVTNKMLSNNFLRDMNTNINNLKKLQEQMTSGKEIRRPSDNPFKVARAMQLHTDINTNKQYNENISDNINWLDTTDTVLGQAGNILQRVRELMVSAGNAAYSSSERKTIKDEINQKISEFSQTVNTSFDGKYVFGGTRASVKPLEVLSNKVAQNGVITKLTNTDLSSGIPSVSGSLAAGTPDTIFKIDVATVSAGAVTDITYTSSADGGKTWTVAAPVSAVPAGSGTFDLGVGVTFTIPTNANNKVASAGPPAVQADEFTFTSTAANANGNNKLVYFSGDSTKPELAIPDVSSINSNYTQYNNISSKLKTEISQGVTIEYNVGANELLQFSAKQSDGTTKAYDLRELFKNITNHLDGNSGDGATVDANATSKITGTDLQGITDTINNLLKIRSEVGAKQNRMESAKDKNEEQNYNMTEILSHTEDIDITEKTMEYSTMQTVYMASLQTSAKVLQPTLMDYLR